MRLQAGDLVTLDLPAGPLWHPHNSQWDGIIGVVSSSSQTDSPTELVTVWSPITQDKIAVYQHRCRVVVAADQEINPILRKIRELHHRQKFYTTYKSQLPSWQL